MSLGFRKYTYVLLVILAASLQGLRAQDSTQPNPTAKDTAALPFPTPPTGSLPFSAMDSLSKKNGSSTNNDALESPVQYAAIDSIRFKIKTKKIIMHGESTVDYEDITLKSEQIELDMDKKEIHARGVKDSSDNVKGRPNFSQGEDVFDADTLKFNFDSKKGLAYGIYTKQNEGYLHSEKTKIMPNKVVNIKGGKFTTCDLHEPHFYIKMTKAKVIPDKKIVTGPAYLVIEDVPLPLVLPFGFFPNRKGRTSGIIIPKPGEEREKGFYFREGGFYLGFSDYVDVKVLGDMYTLGSWRLYGQSNYVKRYKFNGNVSVEYASLKIDEERLPRTFNLNWSHNQDPKANPNSTFNANVNYGSVSHNRQNANNEGEYLNNTTRSSVSYDRRFPNTPLRANVAFTHSQNSLDSIINLTLPQLSFSMSSLNPLKRKKAVGKELFYEKIRLGYSLSGMNRVTAKLDSTFYTQRTIDKFQKGFRHNVPVTASFKFLKYFSFNPSFTYNERWFFERKEHHWDDSMTVTSGLTTSKGGVRTDTLPGFYRVWDYSMGAGISTNIYGMYTFRSKLLRAMRHKLTPSVSYTYRPNFGQDKYNYWGSVQYDANGRTRKYSYYEGNVYDVPGNYKMSSIGISVSNSLEMKVRDRRDTLTNTRKISLIDNVTVSTSYNMAADSLKWDYVNITGNTNVFRRINVRYSARYDLYALARDKDPDSKELVRTNTFMWSKYDSYGRYYRIEDSKWDVSTSLSLGPIDPKEEKKPSAETIPQYSPFKIPWAVNLSYTIAIPRKYYYNEYNFIDSVHSKVIQTMGISSTVTISKNWSVRVSTGWDFEAQKITYTKIDFFRDLHCWDMSFMWIPFGGMQRYEFLVKVKASMFQDLKVSKTKNYGSVY